MRHFSFKRRDSYQVRVEATASASASARERKALSKSATLEPNHRFRSIKFKDSVTNTTEMGEKELDNYSGDDSTRTTVGRMTTLSTIEETGLSRASLTTTNRIGCATTTAQTTTTGIAPRRPSLRRDISHELEFSPTASFSAASSRKSNAKKHSLASMNPPPVRFQDDLLRRMGAQRFFKGFEKMKLVGENNDGEEKRKQLAQSKMAPTSGNVLTSLGPGEDTNAKPAARPRSESTPASHLTIDREESNESNNPTAPASRTISTTDSELSAISTQNSTTTDSTRQSIVVSPSEINISLLEAEPELSILNDKEAEIEQVRTMERRLNRARKLRRTTVMHYDQQEDTFRRRRAPQLFELAVLIDLEPNDGTRDEKLFPKATYAYVPKISFVYPSRTPTNLQPLLTTLPSLCYADLLRARPQDPERYKDEQFLMIITDTTGDRKYAYCHRFAPLDLRKYSSSQQNGHDGQTNKTTLGGSALVASDRSGHVLPQILCIVTPVNAPSFYFDLTHEAALRAKSGNLNMLITFLRQSFRHRLPPPNGFVTVKLIEDEDGEMTSSMVDEEGGQSTTEGADTGWEVVLVNRTTPKKGQGLGQLLEQLGVEILMKLFCALLCEKRVLFVADSVPVLSRSVQAASTMLAPFEWPHTLIPIVPDPFPNLCYSPAPYLMGVLRDHLPNLDELIRDDARDEEENQEEYMLVLDLDRASILKDKDWATATNSNAMESFMSSGSSSSSMATKFLPGRITRSLKQLLKSAMKSDEKKREQKTTDAFQWTFVELIGHYREHIRPENGNSLSSNPCFDRDAFINAPSSKSQRNFLKWFVETGMFQVWINKKMDTWLPATASSSGFGSPPIIDPFDKKLDLLKAAASDQVRGWSWARF